MTLYIIYVIRDVIEPPNPVRDSEVQWVTTWLAVQRSNPLWSQCGRTRLGLSVAPARRHVVYKSSRAEIRAQQSTKLKHFNFFYRRASRFSLTTNKNLPRNELRSVPEPYFRPFAFPWRQNCLILSFKSMVVDIWLKSLRSVLAVLPETFSRAMCPSRRRPQKLVRGVH